MEGYPPPCHTNRATRRSSPSVAAAHPPLAVCELCVPRCSAPSFNKGLGSPSRCQLWKVDMIPFPRSVLSPVNKRLLALAVRERILSARSNKAFGLRASAVDALGYPSIVAASEYVD